MNASKAVPSAQPAVAKTNASKALSGKMMHTHCLKTPHTTTTISSWSKRIFLFIGITHIHATKEVRDGWSKNSNVDLYVDKRWCSGRIMQTDGESLRVRYYDNDNNRQFESVDRDDERLRSKLDNQEYLKFAAGQVLEGTYTVNKRVRIEYITDTKNNYEYDNGQLRSITNPTHTRTKVLTSAKVTLSDRTALSAPTKWHHRYTVLGTTQFVKHYFVYKATYDEWSLEEGNQTKSVWVMESKIAKHIQKRSTRNYSWIPLKLDGDQNGLVKKMEVAKAIVDNSSGYGLLLPMFSKKTCARRLQRPNTELWKAPGNTEEEMVVDGKEDIIQKIWNHLKKIGLDAESLPIVDTIQEENEDAMRFARSVLKNDQDDIAKMCTLMNYNGYLEAIYEILNKLETITQTESVSKTKRHLEELDYGIFIILKVFEDVGWDNAKLIDACDRAVQKISSINPRRRRLMLSEQRTFA